MSQDKFPEGHEPEVLTAMVDVLRRSLQRNSCCPLAAIDVLKVTLATFCLDANKHDHEQAAAMLEDIVGRLARDVRSGGITLVREPGHGPKAH